MNTTSEEKQINIASVKKQINIAKHAVNNLLGRYIKSSDPNLQKKLY